MKLPSKLPVQTLTTLLLLNASVCSAAWINNLPPSSIRLIGTNGDVTFAPASLVTVPGCASNDFYVIKSANNAKLALAILMMAKANAKTVSVFIDDPQPLRDPGTGRPMFTNIVLGD